MAGISRRKFLRSTVALAGASVLVDAKSFGKVLGANERFRIGVAGLNGRGNSHIGAYGGMEDVEIAYLIDPDENVVRRQLRKASSAKGLADVRKALEDKNLDAISIATPNHWHSLMTIWGIQAGKHVYVEKPASHDIREGRIAVEAWKKHGVVVQHGTQRRSDSRIAGLHEAIKAGKWGKLVISYGYACKKRGGIGFKDPSDPPANLDWNIWRGPAKVDDYHGNFVHYNWHWFWVTGNGELNNQGTHQLDMAQWALDDDCGHPVRAMAIGGRFKWDDQGETPNTLFGIAEFANGQSVFFNVRNVNHPGYKHQVENEYYFEDGGKIIGGKYYPKGSDKGENLNVSPGKVTPGGAFGSFIAACRAGDPMMANGNMEIAHYSCVVGHVMNNSYRIGKKVPFNKKAGRFGDNKAAYEHFMKLHTMMRDGAEVAEDKAEYTVGPWLQFDPKTERFVGEHADEANKLVKDPDRRGFEIPETV